MGIELEERNVFQEGTKDDEKQLKEYDQIGTTNGWLQLSDFFCPGLPCA